MNTIRDIVLIMKDISSLTADLIRCQVDHIAVTYKQTLSKLMTWALLVLVAILLALGGIGLIISGLHMQLAARIGPIATGYLLGGILLLLAAIIFLLARSQTKD